MKALLAIAVMVAATTAVLAQEANVDDIRAAQKEANDQCSVVAGTFSARAQAFAANLNHVSTEVATLRDILRQLDAEQDAEQDGGADKAKKDAAPPAITIPKNGPL